MTTITFARHQFPSDTKDSRGAERISHTAAAGRSIHSGVNVSVPSARRIVRCTTPPYTTRRLLDATVLPASGEDAAR